MTKPKLKCICFKPKCVCNGEPRIDPHGLTRGQRHFLALHAKGLIESWRALFQGSMVRATTFKGRTATIRIDEVMDLINRGYMETSHGNSMKATEMGKTI